MSHNASTPIIDAREGDLGPPQGAVLVVEDDRINRLLLTRHVERMGRRVLVADNGIQALATVQRERCDLILLDVMMPEMDGSEVLRELKSSDDLKNIPVIVISGLGEADTAARFIEIGAEDYLTKPFNPLMLHARITASLEKKRLRDTEQAYLRQLLALQQDLDRRNRELQDLNRRLEQIALTDELTGLPNRRSAMAELKRCWAASDRHRQPMACLIVDVDYFKRVNDTFGHDSGDVVLRAVAERLRAAARKNEVVCRLGGEEFIVLCEFTDRVAAEKCGERLRSAVAAAPIRSDAQAYAITVSIGVAARVDATQHPEQLLKAADQAVYLAKQTGRNRVCLAD
ncbi:MAG: diguanylate cyclase [Gemmataceae bacterium]